MLTSLHLHEKSRDAWAYGISQFKPMLIPFNTTMIPRVRVRFTLAGGLTFSLENTTEGNPATWVNFVKKCRRNWPFPVGVLVQEQCKQTMTNKY